MTYESHHYVKNLTVSQLYDIAYIVDPKAKDIKLSIIHNRINIEMQVELVDGDTDEPMTVTDVITLEDYSLTPKDFDGKELQVPYREFMAKVFGKPYLMDYLINF